jgi:integrase
MSPDQARRKAVELLGEMAVGINPNAAKNKDAVERVTVASAFTGFFDAKPSLAVTTKDAYQRTIAVYLQSWARLPIKDITRQMVMTRHRRLSEERGQVTANNVMRHFRSVYNFTAAMYDELPPNPVTILTQARAWHRERRRQTLVPAHLLPAWWQAVMSETDDARDVLLIALFTGMRRSEIITLQWDNVDLVGNLLRLPITKNGDPLELPLAPYIAKLLEQRRGRVGQTPWVFPSRSKTGHITETKTFTQRVSEASGVVFTMHDLRRTFITVAESLDIPAYALKRLLNHRSNNDVTGGYIVISAERLRAPVEQIAEQILEMANDQQVS